MAGDLSRTPDLTGRPDHALQDRGGNHWTKTGMFPYSNLRTSTALGGGASATMASAPFGPD